MKSVSLGLRLAALLVVVASAMIAGAGHTGADGFSPGTSVVLCAYTGTPPGTPCSNQNLAAGANADMTLVLTNPSGSPGLALSATFLPSAATIPGPETNALCADGLDNDADGSTNDGCPSQGWDRESNRCTAAFDDDPADDAAGVGSRINDGCPAVGAAETACADASDNDFDGYYNDGCPAVGGVEAETNAWCDNDSNDDPRDDPYVNDGCPTVGGPEVTCDDNIDNDGDGKVNDGCPAAGAVQAESNECSGSADDDADTLVNDGCPSVGAPPVGAVAGKVYVLDTFGLLNGTCTTDVPSTGYPYLMNATVNNSLPMEYGSLPPGSAGSEGPLEYFRDDGNGNGLPRHVDRYPAFLNQILDPDRVGDINGDRDEFDTVGGIAENPGASSTDWYGTVEPIRPVARYTMSWLGVATRAELLQILVLGPGALAAFLPPHPLSDLSQTAMGYAVVTVIGDPTLPPGPSPATDSCSPSNAMVMLWGATRDNPCTGGSCPNDDTPCYIGCGPTQNACINLSTDVSCPAVNEAGITGCSSTNEAGCVRYANPSTAGTHLFYVYQQSQRDADNDGKENTLDTCPLTYDTLNPRASGGPDADADRIADACDNEGSGNIDSDSDGFVNTQDNCPQYVNEDQKESETITPRATAARRGGSRADGIGDPCDPNPTKADGHFHTVLTVIAKCIGATDSDGDGWCDTDESTYGSLSNNAASTPEHYGLFVPMAVTHSGSGNNPTALAAETGPQCDNGINDDGDAFVNDGCPTTGNNPESGSQCSNAADDDSDGFTNDGCPPVGAAETGCKDESDDDFDGYVNDGCPTVSAEGGARCWGNIDNDIDGFVNDGCPAQTEREPRQPCNDGVDNDLDGLVDALDGGCRPTGLPGHPGYPTCPTNGCVGIDTDGDGYTDKAEILIGTDALGRCEVGAPPGPSGDWPSDLAQGSDSIDKISLQDVTSFVSPAPSRVNTSPGDGGFNVRWDIIPGNSSGDWIALSDITAMTSGATGNPPMFNGQDAFNGPSCTAHPTYGD